LYITVNKNPYNKVLLPYDVSFKILDSLIEEMRKFGRIKKGQLFGRITSIQSMTVKKQSLRFAKFLGFVDEFGEGVKLTELGLRYANSSSEDEKSQILNLYLPNEYREILLWVFQKNRAVEVAEIKDYLKTKWNIKNKRTLDSVLHAFTSTCERAKLIRYRKGRFSSIEALSGGVIPIDGQTRIKKIPLEFEAIEEEPKEAFATISFKAKDGSFNLTIKNDIDWDILETNLRKWREKWKVAK
jgi:hypothetical protein